MALKDWKKVGTLRWRKGGMIIEIYSNLLSNYAKGGWEVIIKNERTSYYYEDKVFQTKSQALKFAKSYMRSH